MPVDKKFIIQREGKDFILYAGLLDLAHNDGLKSITTTLLQIPSDLNGGVCIVQASVETAKGCFAGIGDAAPGNVSRMMAPHLIRMAETRAKARALRDATNVGVTAFEELGDDGGVGSYGEDAPPRPIRQAPPPQAAPGTWPRPEPAQIPAASAQDTARLTGKPSVRDRYLALAADAKRLGLDSIPLPTDDAPDEYIAEMGKKLRARVEAAK